MSPNQNIIMVVLYGYLNMNMCVLLSYNIAFYLAETRQKALPDYAAPYSKSTRSFPFSIEDMKQNCLCMNVFSFLFLSVLVVYLLPQMYFALLALLILIGNAWCFYY